jgi:uncharacterized protein (TIGR02231 family)
MAPTKHELKSTIVAATVLANRAIVTRTGRVKLEIGDNQITLKDLPMSLIENSVRVSGEGPEGAKIMGVEMKKEYLVEVKDEKFLELQKAIEALVHQETAMKNELEELNANLNIMTELSKTVSTDMARGYSRKLLEVGDLDKAVKYIIDQMHEAHSRIRSKNLELFNLQKKINALRGEEGNLNSMRERETNIVNVDIEAPTPGDFDIVVEYAVDGAEWYPVYDARVSTDDMKVDFTYYGIVRQSTGENWTSTVVTLSTAPEAPSTQLPDIQPWYVSAYEPALNRRAPSGTPHRGAMMQMQQAQAPEMLSSCTDKSGMFEGGRGGDGFVEKKKEAAKNQVAKVETSGEAVVYRIEKPSDIPSEEETPKKLTIGKFELPVDIRYLTIPKIVPEIYTKAKVTNNSEFMFLPGDVNLFSDAEFIGTSSMGNVAPTEKFDFSLGITKAIKVKRGLTKREVTSGGVVHKEKRIKYAYRIKIENNKKNDVKVTVKDQLPVSTHEKIKVDGVGYSEGNDPTKKNDLGILEWTFILPSGKKRLIDFEFSLVYPVDMTIEGDID